MPLTESSCERTDDTAVPLKGVKTRLDPDTGDHIQVVTFDDDGGNQAGVLDNPLHVQGAVLTAIETALASLATEAKLELVRALLESLDGKDFATQTTLISIEAAVEKIDDLQNALDSVATDELHTKEQVGLVTDEYDYIDLSYTAGDLTGAVYKTGGAGGSTVATLTLTYDGSGNLDTVTKT